MSKRDLNHYIEMFENHNGTVGRSLVSEAIYAARHGSSENSDRDETAEIMRDLSEKISSGHALRLLIGEAIKTVRQNADLSQTELAERLGTEQPRISNWEAGKREPSNAYKRLIEMEMDIDLTT